MGFILKKSMSYEYEKFFSGKESFEKDLNLYDVNKDGYSITHPSFFSKSNEGGIPLSWTAGKASVRVDQTDSHSLIIGPTGSKKTRLIAMPAVRILGCAGESLIISDPKAEIYTRTAGYLEDRNYDVNVINLRNPDYSMNWNPLSIPYRFYCTGDMDRACEFANDIARNMISRKNEREPFWEDSAASFLFGLILLLFRYCKEYGMPDNHVNLTNIFELRSALFSGTGVEDSFLWEYAKKDAFIRNSLIGTAETAKDTRAGILSTFDQAMRNISIQPNLLNMLSGDELDLDRFLEKKQALYLIMPDEKTSYHGLVSLFIKQSYEYFIHLAQQEAGEGGVGAGFLPVRVNYLLDEFSSLPTVADFPAMVTAARSRNIRFSIFIQSKHQLTQRYGDETETILANCTNWIFLTTRELSLLKEISELCGTKDQKPVLSVSHLQRLSKEEGETLILCGRRKPYVTMLPDISFYDKDKYQTVPPQRRTPPADVEIDLAPLEEAYRESMAIKQQETERFPDAADGPLLSPSKIDEMLADIDRRLAELDEEENENRTELNRGPQ